MNDPHLDKLVAGLSPEACERVTTLHLLLGRLPGIINPAYKAPEPAPEPTKAKPAWVMPTAGQLLRITGNDVTGHTFPVGTVAVVTSPCTWALRGGGMVYAVNVVNKDGVYASPALSECEPAE